MLGERAGCGEKQISREKLRKQLSTLSQFPHGNQPNNQNTCFLESLRADVDEKMSVQTRRRQEWDAHTWDILSLRALEERDTWDILSLRALGELSTLKPPRKFQNLQFISNPPGTFEIHDFL